MSELRLPKKPAVGTCEGNRMKISISFSPDDFEAVRKMAASNGVSFSEQVRQLIAKGREA